MSTHARIVCSRYFDDLRIGERFDTYGRTITEFDLVAFGAITGDCNPQHLDRSFGANGPFGERVAHGALVLSFALGLVPIDPARLIALRGLSNVKFKQPVVIGDTIHADIRISKCSPVGAESGLVVLATRVLNDRRGVAARADIETLWRRAPRSGDPSSNGASEAPLGSDASFSWFDLPFLAL